MKIRRRQFAAILRKINFKAGDEMKTGAWFLVALQVFSLLIVATAYANPPTGNPPEWGVPTPEWNTVMNLSKTAGPPAVVTVRLLNPLPDQKVQWRLMSEKWTPLKHWSPASFQVSPDGATGEATLTLTAADFPPYAPSGLYFLAAQVFPYPWNSKGSLESNVAQINYTNPTPPTLCPVAGPNEPGGPISVMSEWNSEKDDNGLIVSNTQPGVYDFRVFSPGPNAKLYPALHHSTANELFPNMIKKLPPVDLKMYPIEGSKFARVVVSASDFPPDYPDGKYYLSICMPDPTRYGANVWPGVQPGQLYMQRWISLKRNHASTFVPPDANVKIVFPSPVLTPETPGLPEMKVLQPMKLMLALPKPIVAQSVIEVWLSKPGVVPAPQIRSLGVVHLTDFLKAGSPTLTLQYRIATILPPVESGIYSFIVRFPYMAPYQTEYLSGAFRITYPEIPKITPTKSSTHPTTTNTNTTRDPRSQH